MIEIRAEMIRRQGDRADIHVSCETYGDGLDVVEETVAVIRAAMENLKNEDETLQLAVLEKIYKDPVILTCQDGDSKIKLESKRRAAN